MTAIDRRLAYPLAALLVACAGFVENEGFVSLNADGFATKGERFFPLAINYIASVKCGPKGMWVGPTRDYASHDPAIPATPSGDTMTLRTHMELIHELGFNTVRFVGCTDLLFDRDSAWMQMGTGHHLDTNVLLTLESNYERYLKGIGMLLNAARNARLRVILLTQLRPHRQITERHFARIADRFVNDTVILAYDLFNEPLYFDRPERPKEEVRNIVVEWRELFNEHAPNHLCTIGLTGIRETFEFDPNILPFDFISFHPYEYEPEQVRNELLWYHRNVDVPSIIGETAIPADDDSVPYAAQEQFAGKTLLQSRACGAIGYSWWQFQDVKWNRFHADFMGVLSREGTTITSSGAEVRGSAKPVVQEFKQFDPWADPGACLCLSNYLNYSNGRVSKLTGRLVDENGGPILDGVVIAWNEGWDASYHTTSGPDGRFELRGPFYFHHWMASATRYSMDRGDSAPNGFRRDAEGIPAYELGDVVLERLRFIDRSARR